MEITAPKDPRILRPHVLVAKTPMTTAKETAPTPKMDESKSDPTNSCVASSPGTELHVRLPVHSKVPPNTNCRTIVTKYFLVGDRSDFID
jgi:hypothetical protein